MTFRNLERDLQETFEDKPKKQKNDSRKLEMKLELEEKDRSSIMLMKYNMKEILDELFRKQKDSLRS